ncbi:MAG TPA: hypothetical protein VMZ29_12285 [Candidatus Bathyarchaeia archaeon]|nr:hypothetical protein [Candidatus Bathyarchaeia archaeon]
MATYALCYICGRGTKLSNARTCNYCGKYICRRHRINGLCPEHVNSISKEHADALRIQDNIIHWLNRITIPILFFSFLFSFIIINKDNRWFGYIALGIFLVLLMINIFVNRSAKKKIKIIQGEILLSKVQNIGVAFCDNCNTVLPGGTAFCPKCGNNISMSTGSPVQKAPLSFTIASQQSPTAAPQQYKTPSLPLPPPPSTYQQQQYTPSAPTPQPPPPTDKQHIEKLPPPEYQQQYQIPPPPPENKSQQQSGNQDFDSLLEEIVSDNPETKVEIASTYDKTPNSEYHVCSYCNRKFTLTSFTNKCPYCQTPIYRTR